MMRFRTAIRRTCSLLLGGVMAFTCAVNVCAIGFTDTGVRVRDPYVLEHEGTYYMYGTGLAWNGYGCVYSTDLKNWSAPVKVYEPEGACDGDADWWAPECHEYQGNFYLFATYRSAAGGKRGVAIFRSADPLGPFEIITDGHVTPKDHDAIDGTLYVDEDGQPWMVYVGEWTSNEDGVGDMMAAKLSGDLTEFVSEPVLLFRATDPRWANGGVTDGPFLYKTKAGRLLMLWSNTDNKGYCVGIACSANGKVDGQWRQQPWELYKATDEHADGGHGMLFTAPDGTLLLSVHSPNVATDDTPTTAVFVPVSDIGTTLVTKDKDNLFVRLFYRLFFFFDKIAASFETVC